MNKIISEIVDKMNDIDNICSALNESISKNIITEIVDLTQSTQSGKYNRRLKASFNSDGNITPSGLAELKSILNIEINSDVFHHVLNELFLNAKYRLSVTNLIEDIQNAIDHLATKPEWLYIKNEHLHLLDMKIVGMTWEPRKIGIFKGLNVYTSLGKGVPDVVIIGSKTGFKYKSCLLKQELINCTDSNFTNRYNFTLNYDQELVDGNCYATIEL